MNSWGENDRKRSRVRHRGMGRLAKGRGLPGSGVLPSTGELSVGRSQRRGPAAPRLDDVDIIVGGALSVLRQFPSGIAQCCVTSPPYWGLRDYGVPEQIGIESSLSQYLKNLRAVFRQLHRVLRPDGTLWLNVADSYTSGNRGWRAPDRRNGARAMNDRPPNPPGLKDKELVGVPWRLAFALQRQGWYLRSDIVWEKPNPQPESVKDRPAQCHEYVFLLSKKKDYYYDYESIAEPTNGGNQRKNRRSVWSIKTEPYPGAHFATFPTRLARLCIRAGSKVGDLVMDPFFGAGTVGLVCREEGRRFLGIELNPQYAELARARLNVPEERVRVLGQDWP
jgi:site-specific DNA-methyltransferase (cytosine-N4-specific)